MEFITELKKLGLKDKEAAVYVACLELGPSPVQNIARKAKVVRATTYVILESLTEIGLVTQFKEGKKTLFVAEPPRQLVSLIEKQQAELHDKQRELNELLPQLQVIMKAGEGRPSVRYFSGIDGLRAMRQEMVMYTQPGGVWYNYTPMDHLMGIFPADEAAYVKQRVAKGIRSQTIFTTKSPKFRDAFMALSTKMIERRYVPPEIYDSSSGMTIFRDRIAIGTFSGKIGGVILDSESMANLMRSQFELAWKFAGTLDINK